jgi:hypothetical protein
MGKRSLQQNKIKTKKMPYDKKPGAAVRMYDKKGKPAGLMAEGSMAYMESISQEKSNLMQDVPIDNRGISQMSPYKMHGDPDTPHTDPKKKVEKKEENTLSDKDKYIDRKLNELAKTKPDMPPLERLKYAKNSYEMLPKKTK